MDCAHRSSQLSRPSRAFSVASSDPHYVRHINATPSSSRIGGHSNSTSRYVVSSGPSCLALITSYSLVQRDSVHTIQDALSHISQPQPVQVGSSEASQQVLIEALPPVLVLHLKRFLYDTAARGVVKIGKPVQFSPELEIPVGASRLASWLF